MLVNNKDNELEKAIETLDHLLWEAIALFCKKAISKSYTLNGNKVKVVYKTEEDPRNCFEEVLQEIDVIISQNLFIKKEHIKNLNDLKKICSRDEYFDFINHIARDRENCLEVVKIGTVICCPCKGQHVKSTRELERFNIEISKPIRKGRDIYEFRFSVSLKN